MKFKALSYYNGDRDTRFGDCILLYDGPSLIVYDCGHEKHAEAVQTFLQLNPAISAVHVVVSHSHSDHCGGVCSLLDWLRKQGSYSVSVYTHQYLKHLDEILDKVDDGCRSRERLKQALLDVFGEIRVIIEKAQECDFSVVEALKDTTVGSCRIIGPTVEEFILVAASAVDKRADDTVGEGLAEETVMNAASVQLKCKLDNAFMLLLCGDATPDYLNDINSYDMIQLPHHGQLNDAKAVFEKLNDPYAKTYFISDNSGTAKTSGGSDELVKYMRDECYTPARNTKNGVVDMPEINSSGNTTVPRDRGVRLGEMDFRF